jgi:hypothetical protein
MPSLEINLAIYRGNQKVRSKNTTAFGNITDGTVSSFLFRRRAMRISRHLLVGISGLGCCSMLLAAGPATSDLPPKSQNTTPQGVSSGGMAYGFASANGSASGSGTNGQTQATSRAQAQVGGMSQMNNPYGSANGNFPNMPGMPANMLPGNMQQMLNPVMLTPASIQPVAMQPAAMEQGARNPGTVTRRAVATANNSEDKVTTGVDDQYSMVIKVKPNGQIHMIVVTLANMDIRRVQAPNAEELRKKDKLAFTEYQKYLEAE